jgi:hypothetical protein
MLQHGATQRNAASCGPGSSRGRGSSNANDSAGRNERGRRTAVAAGHCPVPVPMWQQGQAQSCCRWGRDEPSRGEDVERASPLPVQMWQHLRSPVRSAEPCQCIARHCGFRRRACTSLSARSRCPAMRPRVQTLPNDSRCVACVGGRDVGPWWTLARADTRVSVGFQHRLLTDEFQVRLVGPCEVVD